MTRKIVWFLILLLLGGGAFLWWFGGRQLAKEEAAKAAAAASATKAAEDQTKADAARFAAAVKAAPAQTLAITSQALADKQAPLTPLDPATVAKNQYTLVDVKMASGETAASRSAYQAALKQILTAYSKGLLGDESTAMLKYLDTGEKTALEPILTSQKNIETALAALLKLSVPASASFLHLQLANSLASLRQIIYNMSQVDREPLLATESADLRVKKYAAVVTAISALDRYFAKPIVQP